MPKKRRKFSDEYKAEVVALVQSGQGISEAARNLGLAESAVHRWVAQAKGLVPPAIVVTPGSNAVLNAPGLSSDERDELVRLRRENARLQMEREILKKAAAFFANDPQ